MMMGTARSMDSESGVYAAVIRKRLETSEVHVLVLHRIRWGHPTYIVMRGRCGAPPHPRLRYFKASIQNVAKKEAPITVTQSPGSSAAVLTRPWRRGT